MKKAQGLSIQTIVIAAIALVVLLVLVAVFTGNMNRIIPGISHLSDCSARGEGAKCVADKSQCSGNVFKIGCPEEGEPEAYKFCCIPTHEKE